MKASVELLNTTERKRLYSIANISGRLGGCGG